MAVAGCINAYDCAGCYLTTLQQLQSDNIGVAINYTAPWEYWRRQLDYIKYTDKCGCTCCLTGENELRIVATQWVIKNFTLTNDEDNEVVNVKWSDVFGGNWAYTMVRYKTGSYPTSITDWTLVVKETTQNQYATNGYNVSWLTDWTTYYFTAFAVSQDGTIIVVQNSNMTTNFDRQPDASTIAYFKFETDKTNSVSWSIELSSSNANITTIDWIKCLYIPWTLQWINIWFRKTDIMAWIVRVKWWFRNWIINQRKYVNASSDHHRQLTIHTDDTIQYWRYEQWYADIQNTKLPTTWRHCIWFTEDSSWAKLFLDWVLVWTNSTVRNFSTLTQNTWIWCRFNNWSYDDAWTWYLWRFALFTSAIDITYYQNFYNKTKNKYWIA